MTATQLALTMPTDPRQIVAQAVEAQGFEPEADPYSEMMLAAEISELVTGHHNDFIAGPLRECRRMSNRAALDSLTEGIRRTRPAKQRMNIDTLPKLDEFAAELLAAYREATA